MSYTTNERKIEQKQEQFKDVLARRGINPESEDDDSEVDSLDADPDQSGESEDDDDVTVDVLTNEWSDIETLNDDRAVHDRLAKLNQKVSWFEENGYDDRADELRPERDALAQLKESKPDDGYGCMMDVRLALGEGVR